MLAPVTPKGPAGGDLTGTYPNPTVAKIRGLTVSISGTILTLAGEWTAQATADAQIPLVAKGHSATQSGDLFQAQKSDGTVEARITATGQLGIGATPSAGQGVSVLTTQTVDASFVANNYELDVVQPSASVSTFVGQRGEVTSIGSTNNGAMILVGIEGLAYHVTNVGIGGLRGVYGLAEYNSTGNSTGGSGMSGVYGESYMQAAGYEDNSYGVYGYAHRDAGSITTQYGVYGTATGAATTNFGGYFTCSGATTNISLQATCGAATCLGLVVSGFAGQTADLIECQDSAGGLLFGVNSSGNVLLSGKSSTTEGRAMGSIVQTWATNTDASRKARIVQNVYDTAAREILRFESDGSVPHAAFGGAITAGVMLTVYTGSDTFTGLQVQANSATQSASLLILADSTGTALSYITAKGFFISPGEARLTGDAMNATNALTSGVLSDLTLTLPLGNFVGRCVLWGTNSTPADGLQIDFGGGTAVVSDVKFGFGGTPLAGSVFFSGVSSSLTGTVGFSTAPSVSVPLVIEFSCVVSTAGTIIPRFANKTAGGTVTIAKGSYFKLDQTYN